MITCWWCFSSTAWLFSYLGRLFCSNRISAALLSYEVFCCFWPALDYFMGRASGRICFWRLERHIWTPFLFRIIKTIGFYLGLGSFVFLLAFGLRSLALDKPRFKWLERASLIVSLLFTVVVSVQ